MPRSCSICTHPRTAEIAKALAAGDSFRDVASRFRVTAAAAQRHLKNCLKTRRRAETSGRDSSPSSTPEPSRFDSLDPKTLVAGTARLVDEALSLLEHAKKADDRRTALVALREARDGLALLMKAAGMLVGEAGGNTTTIDARRQTIQVLGRLSEEELRALASGESSTLANVTDNR